MKLIVNPHKIEIDKSPVNEREIDITKCEFEFADEITNDYVKEAYFTFNGTSYKEIIVNNQCAIPSEVLAKKGQVEIGVVAFLVENEEEIKRYNPSPAYFNTWLGSLKDNAENSEPITPSEMEQFEQALNDGLNEVANVDIDAEQLDNGMSVTITNRYGEDKTVYAYDGEKGETGATPNIQIGTVVTGDHSAVTRTGTNENPIFNFVLEKGDKGDTGNGIANVTKTSTSGLVDTYTITYTNGTTTTFNVTNGKSITNIAKTSTSGLEDTYTITYNDNTTSTFTVTNGNGISSIEKTGTQDNVDTYTIYYTNGTTSTFTVTNSTVTNQEFEELKAEHEELVNTLPRVEGTGESITLDNTAQYKMNVALNPSELNQTTYTGKNLFNFNDTYYNRYSTYTSITVQNNAITIANTNANNAGYLWWNISVEANKDYTISYKDLVETTIVSNDTMLYGVSDTQITDYNSLTGNFTTINKTNKYVTINNTNQYIIVGLRVAPNTTYTISEIQLEQSSTATSYEPYVGGVPSPNPLYPQAIKKVTGDNSITVCGKNLYSGSNELTSRFTYLFPSEIGKTYTLSFKGKVSSGTNRVFLNNYEDLERTSSAIDGGEVRIDTTLTTYSITITSTINGYLYLATATGITAYTFENIMLEINSTATSYESYQSQTYPINLGSLEYCKIGDYSDEFALSTGKNLFDKDNTTYTTGNLQDNGTVNPYNANYITYDYINLENIGLKVGDKITFSLINVYTSDSTTRRFQIYDNSNNVLFNSVLSGTTTISTLSTTTTIPENATKIRFSTRITDIQVQLEKGTQTSYEPYGIGNWYLKKNIGKVVLDGTEIWTNMGWAPPKYAFRVTISDIKQTTGGTRPPNCMSDYYKSDSYNNMQNSESKYGLANRNNQPQIVFRNDDYSTATDFKEWLTTHNTTVYYILATPTTEKITDTTLIEQLNNLYNQIKSHKGQTNITQTNAELPFNIDASALYDLNNLISRVATLEVEV